VNLELSESQQMMRESFARLLDEQSSTARVRSALPSGFDAGLWRQLAALGALGIRVPESSGGLGLGALDATILMEEVGRTLASGPVAECIVAARLLSATASAHAAALLERVLSGQAVVSIAFHDIAERPVQWVVGGAVAEAVLARDGQQLVLLQLADSDRQGEPTLASTPIAELNLTELERIVLGGRDDIDAARAHAQAVEEWKLLMSAALSGLARESIRLAAAYARERLAFGQPIGAYQAISHPLADLITEIDGGKLLLWKTIRDIADGTDDAAAKIPLVLWWNAETASRTVAQALQTFGGYGLTTDYDIHLFNLRAKAWPLVFGDQQCLLEDAGKRFYGLQTAQVPDVGEVNVDFDLDDDAKRFAQEVDAFFTRTLTPELKAKAHYSWDGHDPGVHRMLAQERMLFPYWPAELGGRNATPYAVSAARRMWERHGWGGHATSTTAMVGEVIRRFGTEQLRREVLDRIVAGDVICSLGYSEPGSGSDVFAAKCRATRDGDGWRIDGQKMFTSGANLTDYVLLLTRTNADVAKHQGLTMFIVPLRVPGVQVRPVHTFQDERTNITFYDGVKIPDSYRLGEVDGGVKVMSAGLELEHGGGFGSTQLNLVEAAEAMCRELVRQGRPLIESRAAQVRLARARAHAMISEVLGYRALWVGAEKKPNLAYGPMTKLFSSERFLSDATDLLELTAPDSLSKRTGPAAFLNQCYRHAHGTRIYGGTSQVHRSMIAERNLGLPRSRNK
jgi:alkylation response protein AidB-like acyl-CoA dehydrogenase